MDALGKAVYYQYDAINRLTAIQDGLRRTCYYQYDASSNRNLYLDGEQASSTFTYDAINRLTNVAYTPAGAIVSGGLASNPYYVYDPVSNLVQMGDFWGLHLLAYDYDNRLLQYQYPSGSVVYYQYDPRANVTGRVYPGTSGTAGAAYDNLDRQIQIQAPSGATAYFSYDADSNLTGRVLGDGVALTALYDACDRVSSWRYANASGGSLSYFDYTSGKGPERRPRPGATGR